MEGAGSGVIFDTEGHIITNNHVVTGSDKITVTFSDGTKTEAIIIGVDKKADVAVIKIPKLRKLVPAEFADSSKIKVGQWAIAFGSPLGLDHSLSVGVVSGLGRHGFHLTDYENFIQTDAAVNPGNSGGPLLDIYGKVIGINTMIINAPGSGLSFAIPSNTVRRTAQQLIKFGRVQRPYLGVTMQELDEKLIEFFQIKDTNGALIADIYEDSPAHLGGLKKGDIIIRIDNKKVNNTTHVTNYIQTKKPGDSLLIHVLRKGNIYKIKIQLKKMPNKEEEQKLVADTADSSDQSVKGLQTFADKLNTKLSPYGYSLAEIDRHARQKYGITVEKGLYVKTIKKESEASMVKNISEGDVFYKLNHKRIKSFKQLYDLIESGLPNALLELKREDTTFYMVLNF